MLKGVSGRSAGKTIAVLFALILILSSLAVAGCAKKGGEPARKDTLIIALGTNISTPDNHYATGLPAIGANSEIGDVLFRLDANGNPIPWLAKSYEWSADKKTLTLTIRDNVKMQDGKTMTSEDVRYSLDRFVKYSIGKAALSMVTEIKAPDATHVTLTMKAPFDPLVRTLAYTTITIYSKASIDGKSKEEIASKNSPIAGPGPYKLVEFDPGDKMVLDAFPNYWAGKPQFKRVIFRMMPEMSSRIMALESGDVDLIDAISPQEADRLAKNSKLQVLNPPAAGIVRVYLNTQKGPLADKKVRQALYYAIDRESIVKNIFLGKAEVAHSFAPSGTFGYTGDYDVYKYDPEKAKQMLKDAGVTNLKFTVLHSPGRYILSQEVLEAMKADFAKIGVDMTIQNMEWGAFSAAIKLPLKDTKMEATLNWWRSVNGDADNAIADYASKYWPPGNNTPFFKNDQYDKLFDQEQSEVDTAKRGAELKEMQKILMDEVPAWVLYRQPNLWAARSDLQGVEISALSCLQPLYKASLKK